MPNHWWVCHFDQYWKEPLDFNYDISCEHKAKRKASCLCAQIEWHELNYLIFVRYSAAEAWNNLFSCKTLLLGQRLMLQWLNQSTYCKPRIYSSLQDHFVGRPDEVLSWSSMLGLIWPNNSAGKISERKIGRIKWAPISPLLAASRNGSFRTKGFGWET